MNLPPCAAAWMMIVAGAAAAQSAAAPAASPDRGGAVFQRVCAPCHGAGPGTDGAKFLPGTAALASKYQGALPAPLEQRGGLTAEFLRRFVRHGTGAMPMFRRTEVSDVQIDDIAAYLERSARKESP